MNPKQLWTLCTLNNKLNTLNKEGAPMLKYVPLIVTLLGTLGASAFAQNYVQTHLTLFAVLVGVAQVLHAALPSVFGVPSQESINATANVKAGVALLCCLIVLGGSSRSFAQTAPVPTPTPAPIVQANPGGLNFTGGTEITAFRYAGSTSAGTKITQSLDFLDWGATKSNHLSAMGYQFLAPTPGISFYGAGARVDPDLSKLLSKTNVNSGQFGLFAEAALGAAVLTKTTGIGVMLGGGIKYQLTSSLGWNSLSVNYLRLGSTNAVSMSTGLTYIFK